MKYSRRSFLKMSAGATAAGAFGGLGLSLAPAVARAGIAKFDGTKVTTSVCCYCAVGCGLLVHTNTRTMVAVNVEGDPDHPINEGALCPKGAALRQLGDNKARGSLPLYRAPYATEWKELEWHEAIEMVAKRIKKTRDETFIEKNERGQTVNRTEGMCSFGSAAMDNEECWTYQAFLRSLGLVNIEHQARI